MRVYQVIFLTTRRDWTVKRADNRKKNQVFRWIVGMYSLIVVGLFGGYVWIYGEANAFYDNTLNELIEVREDALHNIKNVNPRTFNIRSEGAVYDKEGNMLTKLKEQDYKYLPIDEMKEEIKQAIISIEDERFYDHNGMDVKAITRAFALLVVNKGEIQQGGSTITQQLAKNMFLTQMKTFDRKFAELFISLELEKEFTKDQILEYYLNNIYFGRGKYGIETASLYYFSKSSNDLTVPEIAMLLSVPNNPSLYDLFDNMENAKKRQQTILMKMHQLGYLNDAQYAEAKEAQVVLNVLKSEQYKPTYQTEYAIFDATETLMRLNGFAFKYDFKSNEERAKYEEAYKESFNKWNQEIRRGGYHIYTSLDSNAQKILQEAVDSGMRGYRAKQNNGTYKTQSAGVLLDNETNHVIAIVGGRTQDGVEQWFNRANQAYRQPGSTAKPIVAYTPAFERGLTAYSKYEDKKDTRDKYFPNNVDGVYRGYVTLREAVERSINTIPYSLAKQYNPYELLGYLTKMQFNKMVDEDRHAGIAIGGFTYGVTPLEMAGAYSTLANNGIFVSPSAIVKIVNAHGDVVYADNRYGERVYRADSAYMMVDVLKGVVTNKRGSAYGYALPNMTTAGKTGTTNDNKDAWFIGFTPYYTGVVWVGNDKPSRIQGLYGSTTPGKIWYSFMSKMHKGLPNKEFEKPSDVYVVYRDQQTFELYLEEGPNRQKEWVTKGEYESVVEMEKVREEEAKRAEEERERERELERQRAEEERKLQEALKREQEKNNPAPSEPIEVPDGVDNIMDYPDNNAPNNNQNGQDSSNGQNGQ